MPTIRKNGKAYSNGSVFVNMFGSTDHEVTEITYGSTQAHTPNYALGNDKPSSYGMGKIEMSCSITMRMESVSKIEKAAGGDLLKIKPFPINVTFVDDENEIVNDTIIAKFASQGRTAGGDDDLKQQFDLFVVDIEYNNA